MPTLLCSFRLPVPPAPTVPALMIVGAGGAGELLVVGVADQEEQRLGAVLLVELFEGVGQQRGVVDHHDVDVVAERAQPGREALDLRLVGLLEEVREALARLPLVGVVVAGHPDALDLDDRLA